MFAFVRAGVSMSTGPGFRTAIGGPIIIFPRLRLYTRVHIVIFNIHFVRRSTRHERSPVLGELSTVE